MNEKWKDQNSSYKLFLRRLSSNFTFDTRFCGQRKGVLVKKNFLIIHIWLKFYHFITVALLQKSFHRQERRISMMKRENRTWYIINFFHWQKSLWRLHLYYLQSSLEWSHFKCGFWNSKSVLRFCTDLRWRSPQKSMVQRQADSLSLSNFSNCPL